MRRLPAAAATARRKRAHGNGCVMLRTIPRADAMEFFSKLISLARPGVAALAERNAALEADAARGRTVEATLRDACAALEARVAACEAEAAKAQEQLQQEIQDRRRTEQS